MIRTLSTLRSTFHLRALVALLLVLVTLPMQADISRGQEGTISRVVVVQTLGNQSERYVAGKNAAVLVYMGQPTAVSPDKQKVEVKLGGATVATLGPSASASPTNPLIFLCPNSAACGNWKAGEYTFTANVNGATAEAKASFQERSGLRVLAVPVKANYGPGDVRSVSGTWRKAGEFVRTVYPLAPDRFEITFGPEVDASADKYNLTTDEGQAEMFGEIVKLQPNDCFRTPRPANLKGCYDKVVAFVKDRMGAEGNLQGFTMGFGTNIAVESDDDAPATVAHEIGHNYDLGDEYQGGQFNCEINPPPPSFEGINFNNNEEQPYLCQRSTSGRFEETGASLIKADTDIPFEIGGRGLLPDMASFMGSGAPQERNWISPASWKQIYDKLTPVPGQTTPGSNPTPTSASSEPPTPTGGDDPTPVTEEPPTPAGPETRWIYAQGYIAQDGTVDVSPWYSYLTNETEEQDSGTGEYVLQALDAEDKPLASVALQVDFIVVDNPKQLNEAFFGAVLPFPDTTTHFQITKGDQVLQDRPVSANAPVVRVISPAPGEEPQGETWTVKWEASDADNDPLLYDLEYSPDGEEWELIESELEETEVELDLSELSGTTDPTGQFRVTATDGINATQAVSEKFAIAPKAPEVFIDSPEPDASFAEGEEVYFEGWAYDTQDEDLTTEEQLVWSSDIQGELGKGDYLILTDLKPGKHTITLAATNSMSVSSTGSIVVNITEGSQREDTTPTTDEDQNGTPEPGEASATAVSPTSAPAGSGQPSSNSGGNSPILWIVIATFVLVAMGVAGLLLMRKRGTPA